VYLNHGSFGACPRPVFEAYQRYQRELERQPVEFLALERSFPERLDAARTALAATSGRARTALAFATNASSAVNAGRAVARSGSRRRGADGRRRVRRDGAALGIRRTSHRCERGAPRVRRSRPHRADQGRLLLAHRVDERTRQRCRGNLSPRARRRRALDRRRRARARSDRPRPRRDRRRRVRRQLPQMDVRPEGIGASSTRGETPSG